MDPNFKDKPDKELTPNERKWETAFTNWSGFGFVADKEHPKPGPHPDETHPWNIDPQAFIEFRGYKNVILKNLGQDEEGDEY